MEGESVTFKFGIQVPNACPPTCQNPSVHTQYLLAAAVYFEGGCWGWIPAFAPDPVIVRQEFSVRKVLGPMAQYRVLKDRMLEGDVEVMYHPVMDMNDQDKDEKSQDEGSVFGHVSTQWSPIHGLVFTLPGLVSSTHAYIPLKVESHTEILELSCAFIQKEDFHFK